MGTISTMYYQLLFKTYLKRNFLVLVLNATPEKQMLGTFGNCKLSLANLLKGVGLSMVFVAQLSICILLILTRSNQAGWLP